MFWVVGWVSRLFHFAFAVASFPYVGVTEGDPSACASCVGVTVVEVAALGGLLFWLVWCSPGWHVVCSLFDVVLNTLLTVFGGCKWAASVCSGRLFAFSVRLLASVGSW